MVQDKLMVLKAGYQEQLDKVEAVRTELAQKVAIFPDSTVHNFQKFLDLKK